MREFGGTNNWLFRRAVGGVNTMRCQTPQLNATVRYKGQTEDIYARLKTPDCKNPVSTNANLGWARPGAPTDTNGDEWKIQEFCVRFVPMGGDAGGKKCPLKAYALPLPRHATHKRTLDDSASLI